MATIKIILRNKPNQEGLSPVVLKIIKNRKIKVITLGWKCSEKDWDESSQTFKKSHPNYIQRNLTLQKFKSKAYKIIDDFYLNGEEDFTLNQFELKFRGKEISQKTVLEFWDEKVEDMIKAGRIGNSKAYKTTKLSFFRFCNNKKLMFKEITPTMLDKYEIYLREQKNMDGGIAVKMRELRALYNDAIKKNLVDVKYYPFKTYKISKLKGKGIKRALTMEEVKKIIDLNVNKHPHLIDAKNYFIFSYYTRGMNFYDMLKLTWNFIDEDRIYYTRSKTKKRFTIKILEPVKAILKYYKHQYRNTPFVFPILLQEGLTPMQIENRKDKTIKRYNKQLKEIASIVGINKTVTSYTARHSFATNLKFSGISADIIGEAMGHSNVEITNAYLKEFDNDVIDDAMNKLIQEPPLKYA